MGTIDPQVWELRTPAFILKEDELRGDISGFQKALSSRFSESIVGYSVKTNSLPYSLSIAREEGCYAEVVSYHEYELAIKCGFEKSHIIYNGPLKSRETFLDAITNGAIVNIETWREIEWLEDLPKENIWPVGIRMNIDISHVSPEDADHEEDDSRFGFSAKSGDLKEALRRIRSLSHVKLTGLHIHRTSKARRVSFYSHSIQYAIEVIDSYGIDPSYIDVGGGYFGPMPGKPTFEDYARAIQEALGSKYADLKVIVEPGNALVASAFDYIMSVIDVKQHNHKTYITTDGTRNDVDPFFHKSSYFWTPLTRGEREKSDAPQVIGGLTCLEYDRLMELEPGTSALRVGDRIHLERVGAYTMALTPLFIHYFPIVYSKCGDTFRVIRQEWGAEEFIQKSIY